MSSVTAKADYGSRSQGPYVRTLVSGQPGCMTGEATLHLEYQKTFDYLEKGGGGKAILNS